MPDVDDKPAAFPAAFLSRLRFPQLFLILGALFFADLFIPDMLPFLDEAVLFLLTAMVGSLRNKDRVDGDGPEKPPEKDVTPGRS